MTDERQAGLRAQEAIAFLRSVIASGERLNADDNAHLDAIVAALAAQVPAQVPAEDEYLDVSLDPLAQVPAPEEMDVERLVTAMARTPSAIRDLWADGHSDRAAEYVAAEYRALGVESKEEGAG